MVANLTLRLPRCIDVAITTSMICCEVNLLSNVEANVEFDFIVSTLQRHCGFDVVISMLQQYCQNKIHSTP